MDSHGHGNAQAFCSEIDCDSECYHDNSGDSLRDSCCEGLEDCIPRLLKWVFGLVFLIGGILVELTMVIPCLCSPCCRKETEKEATAAPAAGDVVQAQAVEVALAPSSNSTV